MHFAINSRQVMSETIDGETIVIHLGTGSYYSLREVGADVWAAIARGANHEQVLDEVVAGYDVSREDAEAAVSPLLRELEDEQLILQGANGVAYEAASRSGERAAFAAPTLEKHTDMQDIILLDPVHEVDDRGWPHVAESATG